MLTKIRILGPVLILAIVLLGTWSVEACSCAGLQTCQFAAGSTAVFVGTVVDSTETTRKVRHRELPMGGDWEINDYTETRQISRLSVEEGFIGTDGKREILIETETSSSCGFRLEKGVAYLVYASQRKDEENLMTHLCSGTQPASSATKDLAYLRDEKGSRGTVSGKVGFGDAGDDPRPLSKYNVTTVRLIGAGTQFDTLIASDGSYKFSDIPLGDYTVGPVLPDSLTTEDNYHPDLARELEIADPNKIGVGERGCVIRNYTVVENGRVSGRLTDTRGGPIDNVTVYLVPVNNNGRRLPQEEDDPRLYIASRENGLFFLKGLPAGRYLVGVRLDDYVCNDCADARFQKTFYPGVVNETKATLVTVRAGMLTGDINFSLGLTYVPREITGRVRYSNGEAAANASVRYVARTPDHKDNSIRFIKTDNDGKFVFTGYENHAYLIGAFVNGRDGRSQEARAVVTHVGAGKPVKEVVLVLDQTGDCKNCFDSEFPTLKTKRTRH